MFFGNNYQRPGKGVNKRPEGTPRISIFFEILWMKLWSLCKLSVLYVISAIPTLIVVMFFAGAISSPITNSVSSFLLFSNETNSQVSLNPDEIMVSLVWLDFSIRFFVGLLFMVFLGMGPVTAGASFVVRNFAREEQAWVWSDFWQHAKSNFGQALIVWILDILVCFVLGTAAKFYSNMGGAGVILTAFMLSIVIIYIMMHFYIYQLMVTFKLSIAQLFKNSLAFAISNLFKNLLLLVVLALLHIGIALTLALTANLMFLLLFMLLEVVLLVAVSAFTTNFFVYPITEKYIKLADEKIEAEADASQLAE